MDAEGMVLLRENGTLRFGEIRGGVPGITQKSLSTALKALEKLNLIDRKMYAVIPPKVEYTLTSLGQSLMEPLDSLIEWTIRNEKELTA